MEDDLLITNTFIPLSFDDTEASDMSKDLRRSKVSQYVDAHKQEPIKKIQERKVSKKEARVVISVNSNQRNLTTESDLTDPAEYLNYVSKDSYQQFSDLYNLAKNLNRTVQTYAEYTAQNGAPTINVITNPLTRDIVSEMLASTYQMVSSTRAFTFPTTVVDINANLLSMLTDIAANVNGRSDYVSMANVLNAFVASGTAFNPNNFWRPFYSTGNNNSQKPAIRQIVYKEQLPNHYTVTLPRIISHVKSIRLISTEIPNTVSNITERNNIITIQLQYYTQVLKQWIDVPLNSDVSLFNFILVKLDVGLYTIESLIHHMKEKINTACEANTAKKYGDMFEITFDNSTGVINIICKRQEVRFHLKFYTELTDVVSIVNPGNPAQTLGKSQGVITSYGRDLWYLLGFPWPYEITSDGSNKYTAKLTNQVPFGLHSVFAKAHINNDVFDRTKPAITASFNEIYSSQLATGKYDVLNTYKPYRYPDISVKYIYMVLRGYKSISHINQYNGVVSFKDNDVFAKVLLNAQPGETCYNTYIDNPLVFLNAQDKIESLEVSWVDEQGNLVDFNKVDHSFTLEIIQYVTQVESNAYHTSLGEIDDKSYPEWLIGGNHNPK
jgi:hypothetical protein